MYDDCNNNIDKDSVRVEFGVLSFKAGFRDCGVGFTWREENGVTYKFWSEVGENWWGIGTLAGGYKCYTGCRAKT